MKKLFIYSLVAVMAFAVAPVFAGDKPAAAKAGENETKPYKEITSAELEKILAEGKAVVLDSRGGKWFDGEVIKGAKSLPADKVTKENLAKLGVKEDTQIVFYCTDIHCPASKSAAHKAAELGFKNLYKYAGGIVEWKKEGRPTDKIEEFKE